MKIKKDKYASRRQWDKIPQKTLVQLYIKQQQEEILLPQLNKLDFDARLYPTHKGKHYAITILKKNTPKFLNYIGKCPIKSMEYKWGEM